MAVLTTKKGIKFKFDPLVYDEKNLSKTRLSNGGSDVEGIWIVVSEKDKKDLDNDKKDGYFIAMLANSALNFNFQSWGLHILCKHNGDERPTSDVTWIDYDDPKNQIFSTDCNKESSEEES